MQTTKVKTAVVGCGMISSIYIRNLSQMFSVIDLCAVCNRTRETAVARAKDDISGALAAMLDAKRSADAEIVLAKDAKISAQFGS